MTNFGKIVTIIVIGLTGAAGFEGGKRFEDRDLRPVEVANGCAYYNMENGAFTWGPKPITIGMMPSDGPDLTSVAHAMQKVIHNGKGKN